jgi:hypothetical protein
MSDKTFQLSVEVLQSKAVQYFVIGVFILLILSYCKSWFGDSASAVSQKYLADKKPPTR